jgi:hypothetical protein
LIAAETSQYSPLLSLMVGLFSARIEPVEQMIDSRDCINAVLLIETSTTIAPITSTIGLKPEVYFSFPKVGHSVCCSRISSLAALFDQ